MTEVVDCGHEYNLLIFFYFTAVNVVIQVIETDQLYLILVVDNNSIILTRSVQN